MPDYPIVSCPQCGLRMRACLLSRHVAAHRPRDERLTVPPAVQETMCRLYRHKRMSVRAIAAETYWGAGTVRRVLVLNGVDLRPPGSHRAPKIDSGEVLRRTELYGRGLSIEEIAGLCGVTYEAIRQTLIREGVRRRGRGNLRWQRARREAASSPASPTGRATDA